MILYKYYGYSAGLAALKSSQLGFRIPRYFNDPFELTSLIDDEKSLDALKSNVCILSMTRSPLNPLMWSHYGEEHKGFVIGYDVNSELLTSPELNFVTVHEGDVIYTNTKTPLYGPSPLEVILLRTMGAFEGRVKTLEEESREIELKNVSRKIFLTKNTAWAYEEEVRVVKKLHDYWSGWLPEHEHLLKYTDMSIHSAQDGSKAGVRGLLIFDHPIRIHEVYFGCRNPLVIFSPFTKDIHKDFSLVSRARSQSWKIFKCTPEKHSWNLGVDSIDENLLAVPTSEAFQ